MTPYKTDRALSDIDYLALRERVRILESALQPFAAAGEAWREITGPGRESSAYGPAGYAHEVTVGELLAASAALADHREKP